MLRLTFAAALLVTAAPAAAEDWFFLFHHGEAPARVVSLYDADSVDRTNAAVPTLDLASVYETPVEGVTSSTAKFAIDCNGSKVRPVAIELRGADGMVLEAETLENEPFDSINQGSTFDQARIVVCENKPWNGALALGKGKALAQITKELLEDK